MACEQHGVLTDFVPRPKRCNVRIMINGISFQMSRVDDRVASRDKAEARITWRKDAQKGIALQYKADSYKKRRDSEMEAASRHSPLSPVPSFSLTQECVSRRCPLPSAFCSFAMLLSS
jgi:hypothetical protein